MKPPESGTTSPPPECEQERSAATETPTPPSTRQSLALRHHLWAHSIGALRLTVGCWGPDKGRWVFDRETAEGDAASEGQPKRDSGSSRTQAVWQG